MARSTLAQSFTNYIRALNEKGILDDNFNSLEMIQNEGNKPMFILDILNSYFLEAEELIAKLTRYMFEPVINYARVKNYAHRLKGRSSGIGGCRVVQACLQLESACDENNRGRCLESFERLNEDYGTLLKNLCHICVIERARLVNQARRRRQP